MKIIHDLLIFVVAIISWEFVRSAWFRDKIGYLFIIGIVLSFNFSICGLTALTLLFFCLHQVLAAIILGSLALIGLLFRVTNGFGVNF